MMNTLFVTACCLIPADPSLMLEQTDENDPRRVRVVACVAAERLQGIAQGPVSTDRGRKLLTLSILDPQNRVAVPMLGRYQRDADRLIFTPRFPLSHGQNYRASLNLSSQDQQTLDYAVPRRQPASRAVVRAIYPSSNILPANNLKFYLHFSKPMREGSAVFDRIHLLDANGQRVADPWRHTELWTADATRFTLWIHPGRIKRGVNLRQDFGSVLKPGQNYTLVVTQELQDADGQLLERAAAKRFRVGKEDHHRPLPRQWSLNVPAAGTKDPLAVDFGEPLDHALLQRCLNIRQGDGRRVEAYVLPKKHESAAEIRPVQPWAATEHFLVVDAILEDLAGNTPARIFDTDLEAPLAERAVPEIPFRPVP